jgi:hypothetical protein
MSGKHIVLDVSHENKFNAVASGKHGGKDAG